MSAVQSRRSRLNRRQIQLLKLLMRRAGPRAITVPPFLRWAAISLWHRDLVEVWYQQVRGMQPALRGPFFGLTVAGSKLASCFFDDGEDAVPAFIEARLAPDRRTAVKVRNYNPALGQAFQGDVSIIPVPAGIAVATIDEIRPVDGRLIIQEGEATGHHHAVYLLDTARFPDADVAFHAAGNTTKRTQSERSARLYRDPAVAQEMVSRGILSRADLAVGILVVTGKSVIVSHEEHDGIRLPPGKYLIGRQVESVGAEERVVAD